MRRAGLAARDSLGTRRQACARVAARALDYRTQTLTLDWATPQANSNYNVIIYILNITLYKNAKKKSSESFY